MSQNPFFQGAAVGRSDRGCSYSPELFCEGAGRRQGSGGVRGTLPVLPGCRDVPGGLACSDQCFLCRKTLGLLRQVLSAALSPVPPAVYSSGGLSAQVPSSSGSARSAGCQIPPPQLPLRRDDRLCAPNTALYLCQLLSSAVLAASAANLKGSFHPNSRREASSPGASLKPRAALRCLVHPRWSGSQHAPVTPVRSPAALPGARAW